MESKKQGEKLDICYILKDHYILHLSTCWVQTTGQTVVAHCMIYREKYYTAPVFQKYFKLKYFLSAFSCKVDNLSCLIPMPFNKQHCAALMLKIFIKKKKTTVLKDITVTSQECPVLSVCQLFHFSSLNKKIWLKSKNTTQLFHTEEVNVLV